MSSVHMVLPEGVFDPARPSGGNTFDRRVCSGLAAAGWTVRVHEATGAWPKPDAAALEALFDLADRLPDDEVVIVDGLVASAAPEVLVPAAARLRLVVLVHMPLGRATGNGDRRRESAVLSAARSVVTTSAWTRRELMTLYALPGDRVRLAEPGADPAQLARGTRGHGSFLSVAAVIPGKGHDLLLDALATLRDLRWRCLCVGSVERDPEFAARMRGQIRDDGLAARVDFCGPQTDGELARSYDGADLLVLPSRGETYGMVVTEALARGLPVVAADVGGVPEALDGGSGGSRPGILVPPDDPAALGAALRSWLEDAPLRRRLRAAARRRRASLRRWPATSSVMAGVLAEVAA